MNNTNDTKKDRRLLYIAGIIIGVGLMVAGLFLRNEEIKTFSGVLIGVGAAGASLLLGALVTHHAELRNPEFRRARRINENDERLTAIRDKAGARTNLIIQWLLFVTILVFVLLDVELYITLALAGLILLNGVLNVVYVSRLSKRL